MSIESTSDGHSDGDFSSGDNVFLPETIVSKTPSTLTIQCPHCGIDKLFSNTDSLALVRCDGCGQTFSLVDDSAESDLGKDDRQLGPFKLLEPLGTGAFGAVYRATDTRLHRDVAIKLPRKGRLTTRETEMFLREARTAAQLQHPGIVSVLEVGWQNEQIYIVSELVDGQTLAEWRKGRLLTTRQAADLCCQIADGLHHAHSHGVVHRDLKPGNIMMDGKERPMIMDFGLAKRHVSDVTMTTDGQVLGTPAYMSPEQAKGESALAGPPADIYAMGVMLFELVTGERPFRGSSQMMIQQLIHEEPPSPRRFNIGVSRDFETVCLRCLEKEPSKRFQSAKDLGDELRRISKGEPIRSRPISRLERLARWCGRNRVTAGLATAVAVSLIVGTVVSLAFATQAIRESRRADARAAEAVRQQQVAATNAAESERQSKRAMRVADIARADSAQTRGRLGQAIRSNLSAAKIAPGWDVGFQSAKLVSEWQSQHRLIGHVPTESSTRWARLFENDKLLVASQGEVPRLEIVNHQSAATLASLQMETLPSHCQIGADGHAYLFVDGRLQKRDLQTLALVSEFDSGSPDSTCSTIQLSSSGHRALVVLDDDRYEMIDTTTMQSIASQRAWPECGFPLKVSLSPSGERVLLNNRGSLYWWNLQTGRSGSISSEGTHFNLFADSDDHVIGLMYHGGQASKFTVFRNRWIDGAPADTAFAGAALGISVLGDLTDVQILMDPKTVSSEKPEFEVTVCFKDGHSKFSTAHFDQPDQSVRSVHDDFVPLAQGNSKLEEIECRRQQILFVGPGGLDIFQLRPRAESLEVESASNERLVASFGMIEIRDGFALTMEKAQAPQRTELATGQMRSFKFERPVSEIGMEMTPLAMSVSDDGKWVSVFWLENDGNAYSGSKCGQKLLATYRARDFQGQLEIDSLIRAEWVEDAKRTKHEVLSLLSDGTEILFGRPSSPMDLRLMDRRDGSVIRTFDGPGNGVLSDKGKHLLIYGLDPGASVVIHSLEHKQEPVTLPALENGIDAVIMSDRTGQVLVTDKADQLHCYDAASGKLVRKQALSGRIVPALQLQRSDHWLGISVDGSRGTLVLVDDEEGRVVQTLMEGVPTRCPLVVDETEKFLLVNHDVNAVVVLNAIDASEVALAVRTPQPPSTLWASGLTRATRSQFNRLIARANETFTNGQHDEAIQQLCELADSVEDSSPGMHHLIEMLARRRRWDEAVERFEASPGRWGDHRYAMCLYAAGDLVGYRQARDQLLDSVKSQDPIHSVFLKMMAVALLPTQPKHQSALRRCAEILAKGTTDYHRVQWGVCTNELHRHDAQTQTPRRAVNSLAPLPRAIALTQNDPTPANIKRLAGVRDALASRIKANDQKPILEVYWHNDIEHLGYINQANALLAELTSDESP